jgi:hypothetical protein
MPALDITPKIPMLSLVHDPMHHALLAYYIYTRFNDVSIGHNTWFIVTCSKLSLLQAQCVYLQQPATMDRV